MNRWQAVEELGGKFDRTKHGSLFLSVVLTRCFFVKNISIFFLFIFSVVLTRCFFLLKIVQIFFFLFNFLDVLTRCFFCWKHFKFSFFFPTSQMSSLFMRYLSRYIDKKKKKRISREFSRNFNSQSRANRGYDCPSFRVVPHLDQRDRVLPYLVELGALHQREGVSRQ